jgi:hypothetical protein
LIILDSLLVGGIGFVLDKIATAVDREMNDEDFLRQELLTAQMQFELGELSEDGFIAREQELLGLLREARRQREGEDEDAGVGLSLGGDRRVVGAEVTFTGDEESGGAES